MPLTFDSHFVQAETWAVSHNYTYCWLQRWNSQV